MQAHAVVALLGVLAEPRLVGAPLRWDAPASCPSQAQVRARLGQRLGPDSAVTPHADVAVEARVESTDDDAYTLRLAVQDGGSTRVREATADDCAVLAEAAVLITATFVGPMRVQLGELPPPPSASPPSPAPIVRPVAPAPRRRVAPPSPTP
ncbi:MAG: hypothetical protein K0V04_24370, partial [Deltaproteobacteria bacterium]|nr:hypothetical protein [Deltaproteobacteria bacterium]